MKNAILIYFYLFQKKYVKNQSFKRTGKMPMEKYLSLEDNEMIKLELIFEELNVQLKILLELISRCKQKKPGLEQEFSKNKICYSI